jgi:hypothetical protein
VQTELGVCVCSMYMSLGVHNWQAIVSSASGCSQSLSQVVTVTVMITEALTMQTVMHDVECNSR